MNACLVLEYIKDIYTWCADHQVDVSVQTHFRSCSLIIWMTAPFEHHQTMKIIKVSDIEEFQGDLSDMIDDILSEMFQEIRTKNKLAQFKVK